jgi:Holliday junction resolvasome RuvABC endonuclease subunit
MMFSICSTLETWTPYIVYVEDTWNKKNIETTKKLSMLIGGIMRQCQIQRIKFKLIYPSQWRSLVGIREGKGIKRQALKESAIELIRELHSIDVVEDEAEGICIGMAGVMIENGDNLFD